MTFSYTRNQTAEDVIFRVQISSDLQNWISEGDPRIIPVNRVENGDGTETLTYRFSEPVADYQRLFGRVEIEHLP